MAQPQIEAKVLSLYSLDTDTDAVISALYHPKCSYTDPLVSVRGHREVKAQFRGLRALLKRSKAEPISSHYVEQNRTLVIDCMLVFRPWYWFFSSFRIRNFIVVSLDDNGLIKSHTDHWSIASLIEAKVGWVYRAARRAFGVATSMIVGWVIKEKAANAPRAIACESKADTDSTNTRLKAS